MTDVQIDIPIDVPGLLWFKIYKNNLSIGKSTYSWLFTSNGFLFSVAEDLDILNKRLNYNLGKYIDAPIKNGFQHRYF